MRIKRSTILNIFINKHILLIQDTENDVNFDYFFTGDLWIMPAMFSAADLATVSTDGPANMKP